MGTQRTPAVSRRCRASWSLKRAAPTTWLREDRATATGPATWPVTPVTTMVLPDRGPVDGTVDGGPVDGEVSADMGSGSLWWRSERRRKQGGWGRGDRQRAGRGGRIDRGRVGE